MQLLGIVTRNSYYFRMGEKVPLIRDFGAGEG